MNRNPVQAAVAAPVLIESTEPSKCEVALEQAAGLNGFTLPTL